MDNLIIERENFILVQLEDDNLDIHKALPLFQKAFARANQYGWPLIVWRKKIVKAKGDLLDLRHLVDYIAEMKFSNKLALVFPAAMETIGFELLVVAIENSGININNFNLIQNAIDWVNE